MRRGGRGRGRGTEEEEGEREVWKRERGMEEVGGRGGERERERGEREDREGGEEREGEITRHTNKTVFLLTLLYRTVWMKLLSQKALLYYYPLHKQNNTIKTQIFNKICVHRTGSEPTIILPIVHAHRLDVTSDQCMPLDSVVRRCIA